MPLYSLNPKTGRLETPQRRMTHLERRLWRYRVIWHDVSHYGVRVAWGWFRQRSPRPYRGLNNDGCCVECGQLLPQYRNKK